VKTTDEAPVALEAKPAGELVFVGEGLVAQESEVLQALGGCALEVVVRVEILAAHDPEGADGRQRPRLPVVEQVRPVRAPDELPVGLARQVHGGLGPGACDADHGVPVDRPLGVGAGAGADLMTAVIKSA
jgi:hypothetical protein